MKAHLFSLIATLLFISNVASALPGGNAELIDGRVKIRFDLDKDTSQGTFQLRSILEQHGFKEVDGFVETHQALAPLEIYNYLYRDGRYVFNIFLPVSDKKFFVSFNDKGFISFGGEAAQRLFDVVKLYVRRTDVNNLEQYKITDRSYCDKTKTGALEYRCWIEM